MTKPRFAGQNILVIGATAALVKDSLFALLEEGVQQLAVTSRKQAEVSALADELQSRCQSHQKIVPFVLNPVDEQEVAGFVAELRQTWPAVDSMIHTIGGTNVAGAGLSSAKRLDAIELDPWKDSFEVNFWSAIYAVKYVGAWMQDQTDRAAALELFCSLSSDRTLTEIGPYGMAKAALEMAVKQWAVYFAQNRRLDGKQLLHEHPIVVNGIMPGYFPGKQNQDKLQGHRGRCILAATPLERYGNAIDLVPWVTSLVQTVPAPFVTGQMICVDGGVSAFSGVQTLENTD